MIREEQSENISEADYKRAEHEKYKKIYGKYSSKLYNICKENCEKVTGNGAFIHALLAGNLPVAFTEDKMSIHPAALELR